MKVEGESVQDFHAKWTAKRLGPQRLPPSFPFSFPSPCVFSKMVSGIKLVTPHSIARARAKRLL